MSYEDIARRAQVVVDFRRTRRLAWIALLPLLAAVYVIVEASGHAEWSVAGLSEEPLLFAACAVGALSLLAHFALWRCPVCKAPLWLRRGFDPGFCHRCGALFLEGRSDVTTLDAEAHRRRQAEAAIAKEIGNYRGLLALRFLRGSILIAAGIGIAVLGRPSATPPPDAVLYHRLGPQGSLIAIVGLGVLIALAGVAFVARGVWGMTAGTRRRTARARGFLDLPPEPRP